jgi:signal transduction histidine kinase
MMATGQSRYSAGELLSVPGLRRNGSPLSIEFTIAAIHVKGEIAGLVAVMRDVTARFEETKALRQKLRALTNPPPPT